MKNTEEKKEKKKKEKKLKVLKGQLVHDGHLTETRARRLGRALYKPEFCEKVIPWYKEGKSDAEVCTKLGMCLQTFYRYLQTYPDFQQAVSLGKSLSQAWWEKLGQEGAQGLVKIQPMIWFANMKNRFGWRDQVLLEDCNHLALNNTVRELKKLVALHKKHEKEF